MSVLVRLARQYRTSFLGSVDARPCRGRAPRSVRPFPAVLGITVGPSRCPSPNVRLNPPRKCRNVDLPSIGYAFRPRLRCRLTPGGRTCPGKPWDSGDLDSHQVFRYSCPRDSQESSPTPQFKSMNSSALSLLHSPTLTSIHDHRKNHSLDLCCQLCREPAVGVRNGGEA